MADVKDYTREMGDTHYNGVPSEYGRRVAEQFKMQPDYCNPGRADGQMHADKRNEQKGP